MRKYNGLPKILNDLKREKIDKESIEKIISPHQKMFAQLGSFMNRFINEIEEI